MALTAPPLSPHVPGAALRLDFRSDTVTQPTAEMIEAMASAPLGDDVFGEDPTVNALEAEAASVFGKEAAVLVASGTQGNLLATLSLTRPGDELLAEVSSHIANAELGSAARLAGVTVRTISGTRGKVSPEQVASMVRPVDIHYARTAMLAIENTHNASGGTVSGPDDLETLADVGREHGMRVHIDGARIFNAAVALGVPPAVLAANAETLTFCLSKSLSAPVGSVLVGSAEAIDEARRFRKMVGGGMRQAGVIAAAGLVALRTCVHRLADDHRRARRLAVGLAAVPGISIDLDSVETNIVRFDVAGIGHTTDTFAAALQQRGIRVLGGARSGVRMVVHRHMDDASIDHALEAITSIEPADAVRDVAAITYG